MKHFRLIIVFLFMTCNVWGQYSSRNNEAKLDADFYMMTQEYDRAIKLYLNILNSEPDNADVKYKLGICYLNTENEKKSAISYLEDATRHVSEKYNPSSFKEMNAPIEAHFLLGSAYRVDNQLDKALRSYQAYKELLNPKDEYNNMLVDLYIKNCQVAAEMMNKPLNLQLTNLGSQINNEVANYSPVLSANGQTLVYTSPGRNGNDIFYSAIRDGVWEEATNITAQLGGSGKMFQTVSLSSDGGTLYLVLQDPFDSEIYYSTYSRNRWSRAESMEKPINGKTNETWASISADGNTIYFTSDRSGGEGDLDIYKSTFTDKGKWSKPVNLGPAVNTMFNEEGPVITTDGSTLYFSSEGHEGMGGYDIYRIDLNDPDAEAENLGYPINTTDNNYFFYPVNGGNSGYYAMNGDDSYGGQDIYMVNIIPPEPVPDATEELLAATDSTLSPEDEVLQTEAETSGDIVEESLLVSADTVEVAEEPLLVETEPVEVAVEPLLVTVIYPTEVAKEPLPAEMEPVEAVEESLSGEAEPVAEGVMETEPESPAGPESLTETGTDVVAPPANENEQVARVPVNSSGAISYTLQLMALKQPVDLIYFRDLTDVSVTRSKDEWYRYTWGKALDMGQAEGLMNELADKGYENAFIVRKETVPNYTIQVMAVPGPVVDLGMFSALPIITVTNGTDIYCRYTTGEYETLEQAETELERIRQLGYPNAFVRRMISLF